MTVTFTINTNLAKPPFNTNVWHDYVNGNMDIIDALFGSLGVGSVQGVWTINTAFVVGQHVIDDVSFSVWRCATNHTSASSGTFEDARVANPTYWTLVSTNLIQRGQWQRNTAYAVADFVYHEQEHIVAYCITAHTSTNDVSQTIRDDSVNWVYIADLKSSVDAARANAISYNFATSTTSIGLVDGELRLNNATPAAVTKIYMDVEDAGGATIRDYLQSLATASSSTNKATLIFRSIGTSSKIMVFTVTGQVGGGGSATIVHYDVVHVLGDTLFDEGEVVSFDAFITGDVGGSPVEGTWTPTLTINNSAVGMFQADEGGVYHIIGNTVFFSGFIALLDKGFGTGTVRIEGLPNNLSGSFLPIGGQNVGRIGSFSAMNNVNGFPALIGEAGTDRLVLYDASFTIATPTVITGGNLSNTSILSFSGFYIK